MTGERTAPGAAGTAEIEYWHGGLRLVAFGMRDASRGLPRDEATAAVGLGALLARHLADDRWPGEYRAVVRAAGSSIEVAEDDLRVAAAREMLTGLREVVWGQKRRDFSVEDLEQARALVLALGPGAPNGLNVEEA